MKQFLLILIVLQIGCKEEKSFADDIVLNFPKDEKMSIEEFNSDSLDFGSNLIYKGFSKDTIQVKYYQDINWIPAPPAVGEKDQSSFILDQSLLPYFHRQPFQGISSENVKITDDLNSENIEIIVKEKDTIPLSKLRNDKVVSFKSYPVFIKNISAKPLKINTDYLAYFSPFVKNKNDKWQKALNTRYVVNECIPPAYPTFFILEPKELFIMAIPYFAGKEKKEFKIKIDSATSKIYKSSITEYIINNQRREIFE